MRALGTGGLPVVTIFFCEWRAVNAVRCWDGEFTKETCCGDAPARTDCWMPEAGLTPEACCAAEERKEWGANAKASFVRFADHVFDVARLQGLLGNATTCDQNYPAIIDFFENDTERSKVSAWWASTRSTQQSSWNMACMDHVFATTKSLLVLEGLLVVWPQIENDGVPAALDMFQIMANRWRVSAKLRAEAAWRREASRVGQYADGHLTILWPTNQKPVKPSSHDGNGASVATSASVSSAVHVAMIASVGKPPFGKKALAGVRSALFFAKARTVHFHLVVDREGLVDMISALATLEPWMRAKGRFELILQENLNDVWAQIKATVPHECLYYKERYGSAGWLRLWAHEIITDPSVEVVAWVDAGDYVFLEDPASLLEFHRKFGPKVVGAPVSHALPFQLFDLRKMRQINWTSFVEHAVGQGLSSEGIADFCLLGEGRTVSKLTHIFPWLWYWFPSHWAYEPWSEWIPGVGLVDMWTNLRAEGIGLVWQQRVFPGIRDYTHVRVYCPDFNDYFGSAAIYSDFSRPALDGEIARALNIHSMSIENATFIDFKNQTLTCNQRVAGVHFVLPFHYAPWVHRFLNFWVGADVWNPRWLEGRDLRV